jgi:hypothetical protein
VINKSASKAATVTFQNGNKSVLWFGSNRNTGETIVWQVVHRNGKPGRSVRVTGGNIAKLAAEIRKLPATEGVTEYHSEAARALLG